MVKVVAMVVAPFVTCALAANVSGYSTVCAAACAAARHTTRHAMAGVKRFDFIRFAVTF